MINTDLWAKAGLTDADIPKDWAGLEAVAKKLTTGKVTGLVIGGECDRIGAFVEQAGGWIVSDDGKTATADTPRDERPASTEVKKMMKAGSLKYAEAGRRRLGRRGVRQGQGRDDHRGQLDPRCAQQGLPEHQGQGRRAARRARPARARCCSATAGASPPRAKNQAAGRRPGQGDDRRRTSRWPSPRRSASCRRRPRAPRSSPTTYPDDAAFADGGEYGQGPVNIPGFDPVMAAFNSNLEHARPGKDPKAILAEPAEEHRSGPQGQVTPSPAASGTRTATRPVPRRPRRTDWHAAGGIQGREGIAGWLFTAPMIVILGLFLFMPDR